MPNLNNELDQEIYLYCSEIGVKLTDLGKGTSNYWGVGACRWRRIWGVANSTSPALDLICCHEIP